MRGRLDIKHEGTLGSTNRTRMTFDEGSIAHLMSILTDLYSDPELAVIREYSTNAADSHRRAGIDKPIEVTLPTPLNPIFVVTDYGVGLSEEEIHENFSKYGWSSKRDDDLETGMLGLGCKSGLTYSSQFTLFATKNGRRVTVLVTREDDGAGAVQVVHAEESDAPNGVEVQVPVKDVSRFRERAEWFFRFWESGTVLVDGEPPRPYEDAESCLRLDPDVFLSDEIKEDIIFMGGVPYPVKREYAHGQRNVALMPQRGFNVMHRVVARVPIGAVDFTPSRENLHYTKRTLEVIDTARAFVEERFHRMAQAFVDEQPTIKDALETASNWSGGWTVYSDYTYRGEKIQFSFWASNEMPVLWWKPWGYEPNNAQKLEGGLPWREAYRAVHFVGYGGRSLSAAAKARITQYMEEHDLKTQYKQVYVYKQRFASPWTDECLIVPWEDVAGIKLPAIKSSRPPYRVLNSEGLSRPEEKLDPLHLNFFIPASEVLENRKELWQVIQDVFRGARLFVVAKDRLVRFMTDHPNVLHINAAIEAESQRFYGSLTEVEKWYIGRNEERHWDSALEDSGLKEVARLKTWNQIIDPEVRAVVEQVAKARKDVEREHRVIGKLRTKLGLPLVRIEKPVELEKRAHKVLENYPLLQFMNGYQYNRSEQREAFVVYINDRYVLANRLHLTRAY